MAIESPLLEDIELAHTLIFVVKLDLECGPLHGWRWRIRLRHLLVRNGVDRFGADLGRWHHVGQIRLQVKHLLQVPQLAEGRKCRGNVADGGAWRARFHAADGAQAYPDVFRQFFLGPTMLLTHLCNTLPQAAQGFNFR
uniref:hypothetical protein n=1 Tax=Hydrogenophaga sp. OTU3427 TaxID=3043856 RepID=UPI00313E7AD8